MAASIKIALRIPEGNTKTNFSIRLKTQLEKESGIYNTISDIIFLNGCPGNFTEMQERLILQGIIDEKYNWLVGDKHVVITGNCLDGSEDSVRTLWLLYSLEYKAVRKGGYLHFLPGSTEIINHSGDWRSMQPSYASHGIGSISRYAILFDGNNELFRWLKTKNILETIGDTTVLQCNLASGFEAFLPKFRGRKFPQEAMEFLSTPLEKIDEMQLKKLHACFDADWLMVVDANTGMVKLSAKHKGIRMYPLPLTYQQGKYYFTKKDPEPGS